MQLMSNQTLETGPCMTVFHAFVATLLLSTAANGACTDAKAEASTTALPGVPVEGTTEGPAEAQPAAKLNWRERLVDSEDGWLDASQFLDSAYGFIPLVAPITEPAVGYGAVGALIFIDRKEPAPGQAYARPNIAVAGGLATENGTTGLFAGHLGNWKQGRLRSLAAVADADINLEYFGLGGSRYADAQAVEYSIDARGGLAGGSIRLGESAFWLGIRYANMSTEVGLTGNSQPPQNEIPANDLNLDLAALTTSATFDTRNNFFTPTEGWYLDVSVPVFREGLGSDRDFETASITAMHFRPLADSLFFGMRAEARTSSDGTPFFLRPFVFLRGVQALRYQGEQAGEIEVELRWQFHPRISAVGFAGSGIARSEVQGSDRDETVVAGGAGIRYLLARQHGLHMGLDVAFGPDDPAFYVVFGNAWIRP